jgi:hypothetical protein
LLRSSIDDEAGDRLGDDGAARRVGPLTIEFDRYHSFAVTGARIPLVAVALVSSEAAERTKALPVLNLWCPRERRFA